MTLPETLKGVLAPSSGCHHKWSIKYISSLTPTLYWCSSFDIIIVGFHGSYMYYLLIKVKYLAIDASFKPGCLHGWCIYSKDIEYLQSFDNESSFSSCDLSYRPLYGSLGSRHFRRRRHMLHFLLGASSSNLHLLLELESDIILKFRIVF